MLKNCRGLYSIFVVVSFHSLITIKETIQTLQIVGVMCSVLHAIASRHSDISTIVMQMSFDYKWNIINWFSSIDWTKRMFKVLRFRSFSPCFILQIKNALKMEFLRNEQQFLCHKHFANYLIDFERQSVRRKGNQIR